MKREQKIKTKIYGVHGNRILKFDCGEVVSFAVVKCNDGIYTVQMYSHDVDDGSYECVVKWDVGLDTRVSGRQINLWLADIADTFGYFHGDIDEFNDYYNENRLDITVG